MERPKNYEKHEAEPTREEIIKELFSRMERESGDGESTNDERIIAADYESRYMEALEDVDFQKQLEEAGFSLTMKWGKNDQGEKMLDFVEIKDNEGKTVFLEDVEASRKMNEERRELTRKNYGTSGNLSDN